MLALFRRFLNTWAARVFFLVLVAAFASWGIADVVRNLGSDTTLATVGGQKIGPEQFQEAFRRQLAQTARGMGGQTELPPDVRRGVASRTLDRLISQTAIAVEIRRLGLAVPDDALRQTIYGFPAFKGPGGKFDRARFDGFLRGNGLTEDRFLGLLRADLTQRQLLGATQAGVAAADALTLPLFQYEAEKRVAETVSLPFAAAPPPPAPDDAALHRYYDNNPESYAVPEYRRIKAVVLSPETLARGIEVPDSELRAAYEQRRAEFVQPETRSVQVLVAADEAKARALLETWRGGADWERMQQAAKEAGASSVQLDDAVPEQIPSPELAKAAFEATPDAVAGPVRTPLGWQVLRVVKVTQGATRSFEQVRDELREAVAEQKAGDVLYERANKVQDALASGSGLDELPGDLGLAAVTGTMDRHADTPEGAPAPLPGSPVLQNALVAAAFAARKGDPAKFTEVPGQGGSGSSYYAVTVEDITPATRKPFAEVADAVRADVLREARRHAQEQAAARLLAAVKGGQKLSDAAAASGLAASTTPPVGRQGVTEGVLPEVSKALFPLKPGEGTMVETGEGFVVAQLTAIQAPDRDADPIGYGQVRDALAKSIAGDVEQGYAAALRARADPRVNRRLLDSLTEAGT